MTERELINQSRNYLMGAESCIERGDHEGYARHMSSLLELLVKELVGEAPTESPLPPGPERPSEAAMRKSQPIEQGGPEQPATEPEQSAAEPEQLGDEIEKTATIEEIQGIKAKSDAAARRTAGNWPY